MITQYFRAIAYHPTERLSVIIDSNGMFDSAGEFSEYLVSKGFKVAEIADDRQFLDVKSPLQSIIEKAEPARDKVFLRAYMKGWPDEITHELDGITYRAYQVGDKIYISDRTKIVVDNSTHVNNSVNTPDNKKPLQAKGSLQTPNEKGNLYKQYMQVKAKNPGAIVFYRVGDFYEVLSEDANTASTMLGITLTSRDLGIGERVPMCGVPFHAIDNYVAKLIEWGFKVAVAEPAA